jgi:DNA-binding CsgD family transcriptional regulator
MDPVTDPPEPNGSDWAVIAGLSAELARCAAAAIGEALRGRGGPSVRLLGRDGHEVGAALPSLEPLAQRSVWTLVPTPSDPVGMARSLNERSLARGVDLRAIVDVQAAAGPIAADESLRDRVRIAHVQMQAILIDERSLVVEGPVLAGGRGKSGWLISDLATVAAANGLWQGTLARSAPLPGDALMLTDRQRAVAGGLLAGETDAMIAKRLRVSVRTVAAEVRVLMDAVGAQSRYQAGMRLFSRRAN